MYPDLASARVGFHFGINTGTDRSAEEMEIVSTGICNLLLTQEGCQSGAQKKQANIELCGDLNFYAPSGVKMQGADGPDLQEETVADGGEEGENWQAAYKALACVPVTDPLRTTTTVYRTW